jgi:two-component system sensor histidine kinase QseC
MSTEGVRGASLRRRLLALLVPATAALWLLGAALLYLQASRASQRLFDRSLAATAGTLLRLTEHEIEEDGVELGVALIRAQADPALPYLQFQIWTPQMREPGVQPGVAPLAPATQDGYGWISIDGRTWRTFSTWNAAHSVQVQVAEEISQRRAYSRSLYRRLALLALLWIPLTALLVGWILTRSFRSLGALTAAIAERSPEDLRAVPGGDAPAEVTPLVAALNRLFGRMRGALQMERRFTADAAHELRSPLAAIRANAQVMQHARSPEELAGAAGDLLASVDRSSHLIDQLLLLARLDAEEAVAREFTTVALADAVGAACGEQREFAAARGVTLREALEPTTIRGSAGLLAILLRNLLDNAIRYSPAGGTVTVGCTPRAGGVELAVSNQGGGIPPEERARIFDRFYRIVGNEDSGSGLGLSIARRIAELHGAHIEVGDAVGGGARFVVTFPG